MRNDISPVVGIAIGQGVKRSGVKMPTIRYWELIGHLAGPLVP